MTRTRLGYAYVSTAEIIEGLSKDINVVTPRDALSVRINFSAYFKSKGFGSGFQ